MPLHIAAQGLFSGVSSIPYAWAVLKIAPWLVLLYVLKRYFNGAANTSERTMHSKVIMMTVRRQLVIQYSELINTLRVALPVLEQRLLVLWHLGVPNSFS